MEATLSTEPSATEARSPASDQSARSVRDPATGLVAEVCQWYDGRRAAVGFRFDDSYVSHIDKAVPMLREYGFKGTFFINAATERYLDRKAEWEACAARGDQEFANHTLHHQGASSDEEVDRELGENSRYIWSLFPHKSRLLLFNRGGGTRWTQATSLDRFYDKYYLIAAQPRLAISMTDKDADKYRTVLGQAIDMGVWFTANFHQIALPWMSDETFRSVLEGAHERRSEIWVAGMIEAYKYQQERNASTLELRSARAGRLTLTLTCGTDRTLYDQPLTIELTLPDGWSAEKLRVRDAEGATIATRAATAAGRSAVRFDVPPAHGVYAVSR
jgi:peptidoglycan/xylan/chitin deacetylase (PgdA/CDA1 family)